MNRIFLHYYNGRYRQTALDTKDPYDTTTQERVIVEMAKRVEPESIIIPVPSSTGHNSSMLFVAEGIARLVPEAVALEAVKRTTPVHSSFECRKYGHPPPTYREHVASMSRIGRIPKTGMIYVIDNVITTGNTIRAVLHHLNQPDGRINIMVYADATGYYPEVKKNPPSVRYCVCGSRDFEDADVIRDVLSVLLPGSTVVHGGARGADSMAGAIAKAMGYQVETWPADWSRHGRSAGPIRNMAMIKTCDKLLAFWDGRSSGTAHSIGVARKLKMDYEVFSL